MMIIKASTALRNDYAGISNLAKETNEPIYITKNGDGDLVVMNIEAFEKREQMLKLRERVLKPWVFQKQEDDWENEQMKYNVEILPAAWEDLKKIEDWYLINFDVETAIKVSDHILDGIERLGDFPDSG